MDKFSKTTWIEIAVAGLLGSLLWWMLYHSLGNTNAPAAATEPTSGVPAAAEAAPTNVTIPPLTSFGYPPPTIPSYSHDCGCGCGAGQTTSPTIQGIIDQTNAVLAAIHNSSVTTMQTLVDIGNSEGNSGVRYVVSE